MAEVILQEVRKVFAGGDAAAVSDLNLHIKDGEFLVLVGPSGCGKSTTLNMIAGLERASGGTIRIGDRVVNDVPVKDRDIAMVFQNYALYPHMTVYKNMAFALKLRGLPKADIDARIRDAAEILGLTRLLDRLPEALSGGQRQRVAVGRAIVRKPQVFLFDEPLSNLDAKLRVQMRVEINELHNRLKTTMIYVTHDQIEAMTMGDRIVVMKDGRVQQVADPVTLYDAPVNRFVAGFIGTPPMNFFAGTIRARDGALWFEEEGGISVPLPPGLHDRAERYRDRGVALGLRPEDIGSPVAEAAPGPARLRGRVKVVEVIGPEAYVYLDSGRSTFVARVDSHRRLAVGEHAELAALMGRARLFDSDTDQAVTDPAVVAQA